MSAAHAPDAPRRLPLDDLDALVEALALRLAGPLPGVEAQRRLAPRPRMGWRPGAKPEDARDAAGLVLLYPREGRAHVVLTLRAETMPTHRGQVSLPGGGLGPGESAVEAALREAHEELAVDASRLRVLGALTPLHIPVSAFVLHPVVAFSREPLAFVPRPEEVARVLETPLGRLVDEGARGVETRSFRGTSFVVPYVDVGGEKLWGATAMILSELLTLCGHPPATLPEP